MRTFEELEQTDSVRSWLDGTLYRQYVHKSPSAEVVFLRFDRAIPADLVMAYASLHECARGWIQRDCDLGGWLTVDTPLEVGTDFVTMPRRTGTSLSAILNSYRDGPPQIAAMQNRFRALRDWSSDPRDRFVAEILARHILEPSAYTVYVSESDTFYITDLSLSRIELHCWRALDTKPIR